MTRVWSDQFVPCDSTDELVASNQVNFVPQLRHALALCYRCFGCCNVKDGRVVYVLDEGMSNFSGVQF